MKKVILICCSFLICFFQVTVYAHSGRTDSNGGHYNRTTGEYHYHNDGNKGYSNNSSNISNSNSTSYDNYDEDESDVKKILGIIVAAICIYAVFKDDKK